MTTRSSEIFAQNFRRFRGNLSQAEFGKRLGISQALVNRYEHGSIPRADRLDKIASKLGVEVSSLMSRNPDTGSTSPKKKKAKESALDDFIAGLPAPVRRMAEELVEKRGYDSVKELVAQLIRAEADRHGIK